MFTGGYADPAPLAFGGAVWLYVNRSVGPQDGTLAFTASDGIQWVPASDLIFPGVSTGRAVLVPDGVRFYYPASAPAADGTRGDPDAPRQIYSALSTDGAAFTDDPGVRLAAVDGDPGGPAVIQVSGRFRMLYDVHAADGAGLVSGEIRGAWSDDGLTWTPDVDPVLVAEEAVEGTQPVAQALHPFLMPGPDASGDPTGAWLLFYNSNAAIYAAWSADGQTWAKLGPVDLAGADFSVLAMGDGALRAWWGTWSEATEGEIWTAEMAIRAR